MLSWRANDICLERSKAVSWQWDRSTSSVDRSDSLHSIATTGFGVHGVEEIARPRAMEAATSTRICPELVGQLRRQNTPQ